MSDHKDRHSRTFATIEHLDEPDSEFAIRKRYRTVMAEKELFRKNNLSTSFVGGRHKDHKWMSGLMMHYRF